MRLWQEEENWRTEIEGFEVGVQTWNGSVWTFQNKTMAFARSYCHQFCVRFLFLFPRRSMELRFDARMITRQRVPLCLPFNSTAASRNAPTPNSFDALVAHFDPICRQITGSSHAWRTQPHITIEHISHQAILAWSAAWRRPFHDFRGSPASSGLRKWSLSTSAAVNFSFSKATPDVGFPWLRCIQGLNRLNFWIWWVWSHNFGEDLGNHGYVG